MEGEEETGFVGEEDRIFEQEQVEGAGSKEGSFRRRGKGKGEDF